MRDNALRRQDLEGYDSLPATATTTARVGTDFPNFWGQFEAQPQRKWQVEVVNQLVKFAKLPKGWDSYNAERFRSDAGMFALEVLEKVMRPRTPVPQIVPTASGGVQLEWHQKGIDLEINIVGPYNCELWYRDHQSGAEPLALEFSSDFSPLNIPITQLTNR